MITREQQRMRLAWDRLCYQFGDDDASWRNDGRAAKYLGALKKTPARIHACGLGMALAFLRSRSSQREAQRAGEDVEVATLRALGYQNDTDLIEKIRNRDAAFLFLATDEAVALIAWMTRLMEGAGVSADEEN